MNRTVVTTGGEVEEVGRCWSKCTKVQLCQMHKSRDLMHGMMAVVDHTVANTENLLSVLATCTQKVTT